MVHNDYKNIYKTHPSKNHDIRIKITLGEIARPFKK